MDYNGFEEVNSTKQVGVRFLLRRMSFGRRLELMRRVRDLGPRLEFLRAGKTQLEEVDAGLLSAEIDRLYLEWGLENVSGLTIEGKKADVAMLIESGPEDLFFEALDLVKKLCFLTENEVKN